MLLGPNTLHLNKDDNAQEEESTSVDDILSESIDSVLDGSALDGESPDKTEEEGGDDEQTSGEDGSQEAEEGEGDEGEGDEAGEGKSGSSEEAGDGDEGTDAPDYSVPEGLSERSTERFNKLVEDNKAQRELVRQHTETLNGMRQMVTDSGLNNEEFIGAIDFAATVKRDPVKGIELMQGYIKHLAKVTGHRPAEMTVDLLEDFPDLRQQVEEMEITEAAALELAQARRQKQGKPQQGGDDFSGQRDYQYAQKQAVAEIADYLKQVSSNDIDWEKKAPILLEAAQFAKEGMHPSKWLAHLKSEYAKINSIAKTLKPKEKRQTPLHGTNQRRGGIKEPQSIEEALDNLL
jgi:hypothetical protein